MLFQSKVRLTQPSTHKSNLDPTEQQTPNHTQLSPTTKGRFSFIPRVRCSLNKKTPPASKLAITPQKNKAPHASMRALFLSNSLIATIHISF